MQITIVAAQAQLGELIEAAKAGEEVVLSDGGKPVAKIVALEQPQKRPFKFGLWEGKLPSPPPDFFDALDDEEQALWDGDA